MKFRSAIHELHIRTDGAILIGAPKSRKWAQDRYTQPSQGNFFIIFAWGETARVGVKSFNIMKRVLQIQH